MNGRISGSLLIPAGIFSICADDRSPAPARRMDGLFVWLRLARTSSKRPGTAKRFVFGICRSASIRIATGSDELVTTEDKALSLAIGIRRAAAMNFGSFAV